MGVLNINVGILGHVDSGKTSLVKALSTVLSTASLDRNPQVRAEIDKNERSKIYFLKSTLECKQDK